jgi:hypothetical protein
MDAYIIATYALDDTLITIGGKSVFGSSRALANKVCFPSPLRVQCPWLEYIRQPRGQGRLPALTIKELPQCPN